MMTFLPVASYEESAVILDYRRLGKQRVECKQILRAMYWGGAWANHPCVKMWRGCAAGLVTYYDYIVMEWRSRGYTHNMMLDPELRERAMLEDLEPSWLGEENIHYSHCNALYTKSPKYYAPIFDKRSIDYYTTYNIAWDTHQPKKRTNYPASVLLAVSQSPVVTF